MIAVIDYDTGNLCSVANALGRLGAEYRITASPDEIRGADRVLLPGVGEASSAMQKLRERSLVEVIRSLTQPVLGICIGVQLLCQSSEEGDTACIGIFDNRVRKFDTLFAEAGILLPDATGTAAPLSDADSCSARQADVPADATILRPAGRLKKRRESPFRTFHRHRPGRLRLLRTLLCAGGERRHDRHDHLRRAVQRRDPQG